MLLVLLNTATLLFGVNSFRLHATNPTYNVATGNDTTTSGVSTQRHIVKTSDGTLHSFLQVGAQNTTCNGTPNLQGLLWFTSADNGATWACQGQMNSDTTNLSYASVTTDASDNIYVVYSLQVNAGNSNAKIFYRMLTKSGSTWTIGTEQSPSIFVPGSGSVAFSYAVVEVDSASHLWVATRYYDGANYEVMVYYSDGLSAAPTWTQSNSSTYLEATAGVTLTAHLPTIVKFNGNIGVLYIAQGGGIKWRYRADTDSLQSWVAESVVNSNAIAYQDLTAVGDSSGHIYIAFDQNTSVLFQYFNGYGWTSQATVSSTGLTNGPVSVSTDGVNAWVVYTDTANISLASTLNGNRTMVYKKGIMPFNTVDFDSTSTAVTSTETTFDQVWLYNGTTYGDLTTAAGNTTTNDVKHGTSLALVFAIGDIAYFGKTAQFDAIEWLLTTSGTTGVVTWEYCSAVNGSNVCTAWSSLTITSPTSPPQFTGGAAQYGAFTVPGDWVASKVNTDSSAKYYIRARTTTGFGTKPVGTQFLSLSQINNVSALSSVSSGVIPVIWTENSLTPSRVKFNGISVSTSNAVGTTEAGTTIGTLGSGGTPGSVDRNSLVKTSDGTMHLFVQTGTQNGINKCGSTLETGIAWITSTDGSTWTCQSILNSDSSLNASAVVDSSDNIYVTYSETAGGNGVAHSTYYRKLTKSGSTWTIGNEQTSLTGGSTAGYDASNIVLDSNNKLWLGERYCQCTSTSNGINAIGYNGSYFLVGGEGGKIAKYDGVTWTDVTSTVNFGNAMINAVSWDSANNLWLIGGGNPTGSTGAKLIQYDGNSTATDITSSLSGWTTYPILSMAYDSTDHYFLIGGGTKNNAAVTRLNKVTYTSGNYAFTDLSGSILNFGTQAVLAISWDSTHDVFLIGGGDSDNSASSPRLNEYTNGGVFTDLSGSLLNWSTYPVLSIAYDSTDNYFLVGGGNGSSAVATKLNKIAFDGATFTYTDKSASVLSFVSKPILSITYNSTSGYFLIGGGLDNTAGGGGYLNKVTGSTTAFTDLTSSFPPSEPIIVTASGGSNNLIGVGFLTTGKNLVFLDKYDGTTMTNLGSNIINTFGGVSYYISVYYSDGTSTSPTWTLSTTSTTYGETVASDPIMVKYGTNIAVFYNNFSNTTTTDWKFREDNDDLTVWSAETVGPGAGSASQNFAHSIVGDASGDIYFEKYTGGTNNTDLYLWGGFAWTGQVRFCTTCNRSSLATDGTSVWNIYTDSTGFLPAQKWFYKKAYYPFTANEFSAATPFVTNQSNFDQVWLYNGSTYENLTTAAGDNTTADVKHSVSLGVVSAIGDIAYFGRSTQFDAISWVLSTAGTVGSVNWEYWNGSGWVSLRNILSTTNSTFLSTTASSVIFTPNSDWATTTVNGVSDYYVRARTTTAYTIKPIGSQFSPFVTPSVMGNIKSVVNFSSMPLVYTVSGTGLAKLKYTTLSDTTNTSDRSATASPHVAYTSDAISIGASTQRHIVTTSDGTIHSFVRGGTYNINGCNQSTGLLWLDSTDNGTTWNCNGQLISDTANLFYASAVADALDNIYVVYAVNTTGANANYNLYYRKLTKGSGATWTLEAQQTVQSGSASIGYSYPTIAHDGSSRLWIATRKYNNPNYTVETYYSNGLTTAPTWTASATLDTAGNIGTYHYPNIVTFGSKIGVIYNDQSALLTKWRWRSDSDAVGTWNTAATVISGNISTPTFSAIGDSHGNIYMAQNLATSVYFTYYNGSAWSTPATVSSTTSSNLFTSVATDETSVWVAYADTNGVSSSLNANRKLVYKQGVSPFATANFDTNPTVMPSYEDTFDKVWVYNSADSGGTYQDVTTAASDTTTSDVIHSVSGKLVSVAGDAIYLGKSTPFDSVSPLLSAAGVGGVLTWEYWNGSGWFTINKMLTTSGPNFTGNGWLNFVPKDNWAKTTINGESTSYYYIRGRVTTSFTNPIPVGTQIVGMSKLVDANFAASTSGKYLIWSEGGGAPYRIKYFGSFSAPNVPTLIGPPRNGAVTGSAIVNGAGQHNTIESYARCFNNGGTCDNNSGSYVQLPSGFSFRDTNSNFTGLTISVWANPTSSNTSWARFLDLAGYNSSFGDGQQADNILFARNATSDDLTYEVYNGSGSTGKVTATGALTENAWHMYSVTEDTSGNVTIYKDGSVVTTGTTGIPANILRYYNYIGKSNWVNNDGYYQGYLDDMMIYKRSLSAIEITGLYNNTANIGNGLYAFYRFNETSGAVAYDSATYNTSTPSIPYLGTLTPKFTFNLTDTGASVNVKYRIQVSSGADMSNVILDYTSESLSQGVGSFTLGTSNAGTYTTGSVNTTLTTNNEYTWQVKTLEATGAAASAYTSPLSFYVDNAAPSSPGSIATTGSTNTSTVGYAIASNKPTWTWGSVSDSGSGLSYYDVKWNTTNSFSSVCSTCESLIAAGTTSFTHSVSLADGYWYFQVQAYDNAGNGSSNPSYGTIYVDTTAPTCAAPTAANTSPNPTWNWTCSDSGVGLKVQPYNVKWSQDNTFSSGVSTATLLHTNSYTNTTVLYPYGNWYFEANATDLLGNVGSYTSSAAVDIENPTTKSFCPNGH